MQSSKTLPRGEPVPIPQRRGKLDAGKDEDDDDFDETGEKKKKSSKIKSVWKRLKTIYIKSQESFQTTGGSS